VTGATTGVQFADGFDGPDSVALGLGAPQLATVVAGGLGGYGLLHAPGPALVRVPVAVVLALLAAALGWGRFADRPLLDWCWLAARYALRPRRGGGALLAVGDGGRDEAEPPWARWLRQGGARRAEAGGGEVRDEAAAADSWTGAAAPGVEDSGGGAAAVDELEPGGDADVDDEGCVAAARPSPASSPDGLGRRLRERWAARRRQADGHSRSAAAASEVARPAVEAQPDSPPRSGRTVELDRPSIVLLPEPLPTGDDDGVRPDDVHADDDTGVTAADDDAVALLHLPRLDADAAALAVAKATAVETPAPPMVGDAPVFVGAARRITFFSLNGGSGRTTLATEVACLLAARGAHRPAPDAAPRPLSVALLDLDLRSANVAMRLGIPQPTILDYLLDAGEDPAAVRRYLVRHHSGLRALLGPPKPLGQAGPGLEPARVAEIVHQLERDGAHFVVIDVGADLGAVTTWVLTAVHDIYVVITPTASGVQDAYRSTEALRRLGLGHKLRYVVNRARGSLDIDEVMGDLGGRVAATIPDDPRVEEAENRHRSVVLEGQGPAAVAIARLAAEIYPALRRPGRRHRFALLGRRRVG